MTSPRVRALLVADDPLRCASLVRELEREGDIAVIGHARAAADSMAIVTTAAPDIVVLDQPADRDRRDVIAEIMNRAPTPILVLSAAAGGRRAPAVVEALVAGALDALPAPGPWTPQTGGQLRETVRRLSKAWVIRHLRGGVGAARPGRGAPGTPVVAMAASTGGPSAFAAVLAGLGGLAAPVLVVQHLHPEFTSGLFDWMARVSALPVEMATDGQRAEAGYVYLAPGGAHLRLGPHSRLQLATEPQTVHRPSADVLFNSVAEHAGAAAVGVVLTGMGDDGARGLLAIRRTGGQTLGQDEASSAVFGMPRAAQRLGAVASVCPLDQVADAVRRAVRLAAAGAAPSAEGRRP